LRKDFIETLKPKEGKLRKTLLMTGLIISICLLMVSGVYAQRLTGSLNGKVIDADGNPLPGVMITITSPALLGARDFITPDTGSFRFPALPPGTYSMTSVLDGFKTVNRSGIIISVGKTVTINTTMELSPIEEEVTVTAVTPVVDLKSSKVTVTYTKELIENIPTNRSLYAIIQTAPGAVADNWIGSASSVHGSVVTGNQYSLDGLNMTSPLTTTPIISVDLSMIEEMEMEIGAHPAEVSNVSGAYINVVTRSGGNDFHGEATVFYFNESFVDENFSKEQLDALGVASPQLNKQERDFSGSFGGPLIRDKLWFFLSGRYYYNESALLGFPQDYTYTLWQGLGKLTLQLTENIKIMSYFNYRDQSTPTYLATDSRTTSPEAAATVALDIKNINGQINWILGPNAFLDIRGMWFTYYRDFKYQDGATHQISDLGTGATTGAFRWEEYIREGRLYTSAALTLFGDNILGGNHELKVGAEFEKTKNHQDCWAHEPLWEYKLFGSPYVYGFPVGQIITLGYGPEEAEEGIIKSETWSLNFYVQDSWTIQDRLTLNLGVRFDSSHGFLPAQVLEEVPMWTWLDPEYFGRRELPEANNLLVFNTFSPRLGLVFDIFGTGKTLAKASYSRYRDNLQLAMFYGANPNAYAYRAYLWIDTNVNQEYDQTDMYIKVFESGRENKIPREQIDQNAKAPYFDEFIIGIEHELLPNFKLGISYYNKKHNNVWEGMEGNAAANWAKPYTVNDPGYDGTFGTEDDAQLTIWDRTTPGNQEPEYFTNPENAWRQYHGLEFIFEKRMSNNWQFLGSIVTSKHTGTIGAEYSNSYSFATAFDNPNWYINREGRLDTDRPLSIKLQGTYILPWGIYLSGYFRHTSGYPYQRTLQIWAPNAGGYVTVNAEAQGSRRTPSTNYASLRLEKTFSFGDATRLGFFIDVYNLFNSAYLDTVAKASVWDQGDWQGYIEADGSFRQNAQWQKVRSISTPRVIKLGLRFTF